MKFNIRRQKENNVFQIVGKSYFNQEFYTQESKHMLGTKKLTKRNAPAIMLPARSARGNQRKKGQGI